MKVNTSISGLVRYRSMLISFALYASVVVTLLFWNYQVNQSTEKINYQQDVLGRLSSDALTMHTTVNELLNDVLRERNDKISEQTQSINQTLAQIKGNFQLLHSGGQYQTLDHSVQIEQLTDVEQVKRLNSFNNIINNFEVLWREALGSLDSKVQDSETGEEVSSIDLPNLTRSVDLINGNLDKIYDLYVQVTLNEMLDIMGKNGVVSRNIIIAISLITALYFTVFVFYFVRRLSISDREAALARREVDDIMETVKEGLFLVDKDLVIGSQYSSQLKSILGQENVANQKLDQLLSKIVTTDALEATRLFLVQLMKKTVVPELIDSLNPISKVKIKTTFGEPERWLSFSFSRVMDGGDISKILVSAADITKEIELERKLEEANAKHDEQIELLSSLLSSEPHLVEGFLNRSRQVTLEINDTLRTEQYDESNLYNKLDIIFREIHSLKGEASAVSLEAYVALCDRFENKIQSLKRQSSLTGEDFLAVAVYLEELEALNDRAVTVFARLNHGQSEKPIVEKNTSKHKQADEIMLLTSLCQQVSERSGKDVQLLANNYTAIPVEIRRSLQDVLIQMVRNAVVHGIETPEQRQKLGKSTEGHIRIRYMEQNGEGMLSIEDDGQGIHFNKLADIARQKGIKADNGNEYSHKQLVSLMFSAGVSTAENSNKDAGRGVGTSVIADRLHQMNAKLQVTSKAGQFTRFVITFKV